MASRGTDTNADLSWNATVCIDHDAPNAHGGSGQFGGTRDLWLDLGRHLCMALQANRDDSCALRGVEGERKCKFIYDVILVVRFVICSPVGKC